MTQDQFARACAAAGRTMPYSLLPPDVLRVGERTLFALRDKTGCLLVPKGTLIDSQDQLGQLLERELYLDEQDGDALRRAMGGKLDGMLRDNETLGRMASARASANDLLGKGAPQPGRRFDDPARVASDLQQRLAAALHDPNHPDFGTRIQHVQQALLALVEGDADDALLVLMHEATMEFRDYSASQALLVATLCDLAARHLGPWPAAQRHSLRCAALTMNVAMTTLQNQLAQQSTPVLPAQRMQIDRHAAQGAALLRSAGIDDPMWIAAVERHHSAPAGALSAQPSGLELARLLQRADVFAARLRPRRSRRALSATAAAKAAYLDENGQPDAAGSAIIKATGLYPPGSFVKLASGEVAVVLRRGVRGSEPIVASIVNPGGMPLAEPVARQTRQPAFKVQGGVAPHEVRVRLNLERLLRMS
jgi:hypothetical protein